MEERLIQEGLLAKYDGKCFILETVLVPNVGIWWPTEINSMGLIRLEAAINEHLKLQAQLEGGSGSI